MAFDDRYGGNLKATGSRPDSRNNSYDTIEYPGDLGTEKHPHYVIFFFNANEKASVVEKSPGNTYDLDLTKRSGQGLGNKVNETSKGRSEGNLNSPSTDESFTQSATNYASAAGDMAKSWVSSRTRRLKEAVVLHAPHQNRSSYNANYEEFTNGGIAGSALHAALSGQGMSTITSNTAQGILKEGTRAAAGALGAVTGIEGASNAVEKARGEVENPRAELLFKTIGIREFEFNYIFAPKTKDETKLIKDIIYVFKYHAHPEISNLAGTGQYLVMPSEVDVSYYYMNAENDYVNKITTCVITSINVDYAPNGQWQAFDGTGIPPHITLSLRLREIEPIYRDLIMKGF